MTSFWTPKQEGIGFQKLGLSWMTFLAFQVQWNGSISVSGLIAAIFEQL